jgi:uncharacterized protein YeeX (DUF496 family)
MNEKSLRDRQYKILVLTIDHIFKYLSEQINKEDLLDFLQSILPEESYKAYWNRYLLKNQTVDKQLNDIKLLDYIEADILDLEDFGGGQF